MIWVTILAHGVIAVLSTMALLNTQAARAGQP
jgi:hypothetical protein